MRTTLITLTLLLSFCLQAQEIKWQEEAKLTYIYEITNSEAEQFVRFSPKDSLLIKKMLHTPRGAFSGQWKEKPQQGHFILVEIEQGRVNYRYASVVPFQVFMFQEYDAFTLQIVDHNENLRDDAKVFIRRPGFGKRWKNTPINFDTKSRTYTLDGYYVQDKEFLMIELGNFRAIFDLTKNIVKPRYGSNNNSPKFYSYLITDKNKYKPGETVRFKSYSLYGTDKKITPVDNELEIWIQTDARRYQDYKKIDLISPYRPGGYAGEIVLHDSLQLKLDNYYTIQLRDKDKRVVATTGFKYEDYELFDNRLETQMNRAHYPPNSNPIEIKALDVNGLFLQDAQAEIVVKRDYVYQVVSHLLQLPDTLMYKKIDLENNKPTIVEIPADLFGEFDCSYRVEVKVLTFDNQLLVSNEQGHFCRSSHGILFFTRNDSVCFVWYELGEFKKMQAQFWVDDSDERQTVEIPFEIQFDKSVKKYNFKIDSLDYSQTYAISDYNIQLDIEGGFNADLFSLKLINPLKLELSWYIYQGERLLTKGSGTEFNVEFPKTDLNKVHYVDLFYLLGGEQKTFRKTFTPNIDFLDVSIDLPDRIYPGQTIDATISVKNIWGEPMEDVDLTAFAYNNPLQYHVPNLSNFGNTPQTRERRANFTMKERKRGLINFPFNYDYWNEKWSLDTLKYFQFTFPRNEMFLHTVNTPDSTTQVAPYVMKNGEAVTIYVIEINNDPVYFSWTQQPKAYSFLITDTVKQRITLRLHDRAIILDSLYFEAGMKTILSIDLDFLPPKAITTMLDTRDEKKRYRFTSAEEKVYSNLISQFPVNDRNDLIFLKKENTVYPISHPCFQPRGKVFAGPIPPGYMEYCGEIRYRHEGGFSYKFEDNVVYKYSLQACPEFIHFSSSTNIKTLNDFALTQKVYDQIVENCKKVKPWHPSNINISQSTKGLHYITINIDVPIHPDSIGTSNLIFRNVETRQLLLPDKQKTACDCKLEYPTIPPATYDVILIYDDGSFLIFDSLTLQPYTYTKLKMKHLPLQEKDSLLMIYGDNNKLSNVVYNVRINEIPKKNDGVPRIESEDIERKPGSFSSGPSTIKGVVKDPNGNSVPFLQILLKQDGRIVNGSYTDERGEYQIFGIAAGIYDLTVGGTVNCSRLHTQTGIYISGSEVKFIDFVVNCASTELDEVRVEYVPPIFFQDNTTSSVKLTGSEVLKTPGYSPNASSRLTGEEIRMTPGRAISNTLNDNSHQQAGKIYKLQSDGVDDEPDYEWHEAEERLYNELLQLNSLRTNFSDVGFWEPKLFTDQQGEAKFTITFPDNITQWNTIVYAMNRKLQTATLRKSIKSYKPLMAELKNPQFLVIGDTSYYAGNIRNHTHDSEIAGQALFIIGGDTTSRKDIRFTSSFQDKMQVTPSTTDSITAIYVFHRDDGYNDGEKRTIPVIPRGAEIADGTLEFLKSGDQKSITAGNQEEIHITLTASPLDIYVNTTSFLRNYRYDCNEQLASKLIGLLTYKMYQEYAGERFKEEKRIKEIINKLVKNRNETQLWSWWGTSPNTNYWMSAHIIRALTQAQKAGYAVNLDLTNIKQDYIYTQRYRSTSLRDIAILNVLSDAGTPQNYAAALEFFDREIAEKEHQADSIARAKKRKNTTSYLNEKLLLLEIRQQQNIGYSSNSIKKYLKTDVLGAVYCDDGIDGRTLDNTVIAYRIASADSTLQHLKEALQLYILRTKRLGWNTYQASSAVMAILPDLLAESANKEAPSTVVLSGKESKELSEFPYTTILYPGEQLGVYMKSGIPLIYSDYQLKRATTEHTGDAFKIETHLSKERLVAGEKATLHVTLQVKQANAEHVMIEVPIPAGCSYASKQRNYNRYAFSGGETYREHFKDKVVIFCEKLPVGTYEYSVELLPRYTGNYYLNPAKVEMMYFPVIYSNNNERRVQIKHTDDTD